MAHEPQTNLDHALGYAVGRGWPVFPCAKTKAPLTTNGFKDAAVFSQHVTHLWNVHGHDSLIGVAVPKGYVVVDVDPRNGGDATLENLKRLGLAFPTTLEARTGSGGLHAWYKVPDDAQLKSTAGPGIDLKRHGKGYVIVPPSVSEAGEYEWLNLADIADLPEQNLKAWLKPEPDPKRLAALDDVEDLLPWENGSPYGLGALSKIVGRMLEAKPGERNNALNSAAFQVGQLVAGKQLRATPAQEQVYAAAEELGLPTYEIDSTYESGFEAGMLEPLVPEPRTPDVVLDVEIEPDDDERAYWMDWDKPLEPVPFYLEPVLPKNAYVLVYGATEASKSMVWNALLAQGSHQGLKSSVYSLENPPYVDQSRMQRLAPDPEFFRITHEPLNLADPAQVKALIAREQGRHVILIDTYSHAFQWRTDDGNAKAIEFARIVRLIIAKTGATVVVIDHTGYSQTDEPRDASAKRQQVDVAILMKREGTWQKGKPSRFSMSNKKAARLANPFEGIRGSIVDTSEAWGPGLKLVWNDEDFTGRWSV